MKEKLSHIPTPEHTAEVKQRIFKEVMGSECRGHVRTVGLGLSPSQYFGGTSSNHQPFDHYMTMILNKVEELYEQKYGGKISDMQAQIDSLNARLQSGQIPRSTSEAQHQKNMPQNINNDDLDGLTMDEGINNEDFE